MLLANGMLLAQADEYYFCFHADNKAQIDSISQIISIDKVADGKVWAYANSREMQLFAQTGIIYELCSEDNSKLSYEMATTIGQMQKWDRYPTYNVYDSMMHKYASDHSDVCLLDTLGTLSSGRQILALKISRDVNNNHTTKPEALCSGSIHGDECVGMVTALHLCDLLLNNANSSGKVQDLIDNVELWVIPLLNPDGMYAAGNGTISGRKRNNGNSADLNRSFPHINNANQNYYEALGQEEIVSVVNFYRKHHISISINYHSGNECFNYPWDTWKRRCADDDWWKMVGGAYRDTAQYYSPRGYFDDDCSNNANGLTNGWDWYSVSGSMQDYVNYYEHCREVTVELSSSKTPEGSALPDIWEYNRRSLINFLSESLNGIRGIVTDVYGVPVSARITVDGYDTDNSWVETDARAGDYHRMIKSGNYRIRCDADGYVSKTESDVKVIDGQPTVVNFVLEKENPEISVNVKKLEAQVASGDSVVKQLIVSNVGNAATRLSVTADTASWLSVGKWHEILNANASDTVSVTLRSENLAAGKYVSTLKFESVSQTTTVNVEMEVLDSDSQDSTITDGNQEQIEYHNVITSVSIAELPSRLLYVIGDTLNVAGGKLSVTYDDGTIIAVDMKKEMVLNFSSVSAGIKILTVRYGTYSTFFTVSVSSESASVDDVLIKHVELSSLPARLVYEIGDSIDLSGGKIAVTYTNDSIVCVDLNRNMISNFNSSSSGQKLVSVRFENFIIYFNVTIMPENVSAMVKKVTVSALPAKMDYQIGDTLDCSGGKLLVMYDNDSSAIVEMNSGMVSGFESETYGSKRLTVTYDTFSIYFFVNVKKPLSLPEFEGNICLYASGKNIIVKNAPCEVLVFDMMGNCVAVGHQGDTAIQISTAGIYIVKVGNASFRVAVE